MRIKLVAAVTLSFALGACGIADHFQAQDRMEKSGAAYRSCVSEHLNDPNHCDPLKVIYENDKATFEKS